MQAERPVDYSWRYGLYWRFTVGNRPVVYWDPACAVALNCSFRV